MRKFFCDIFTVAGGEHWDYGRIVTVLGVFALLGYQTVSLVVLKHVFDPLAFGGGFAAIAALGTAANAAQDRARGKVRQGE